MSVYRVLLSAPQTGGRVSVGVDDGGPVALAWAIGELDGEFEAGGGAAELDTAGGAAELDAELDTAGGAAELDTTGGTAELDAPTEAVVL